MRFVSAVLGARLKDQNRTPIATFLFNGTHLALPVKDIVNYFQNLKTFTLKIQ